MLQSGLAMDEIVRKAALKQAMELVEKIPHDELERILADLRRAQIAEPAPMHDHPQKFIIWKS